MKPLTRFEKISGVATSLVAILVLVGYWPKIVGAVGIATTESVNTSVDTKVAAAVGELREIILADKKDNVEFWINYLNFKANRGEANDFDMTMLEQKYRQLDDLSRGNSK